MHSFLTNQRITACNTRAQIRFKFLDENNIHIFNNCIVILITGFCIVKEHASFAYNEATIQSIFFVRRKV